MWPELQDDHLENSRKYIFIQFLAIFFLNQIFTIR